LILLHTIRAKNLGNPELFGDELFKEREKEEAIEFVIGSYATNRFG
jgi:hypothetical protein